jgi:uncharacterized heparinase superfamily protein
LDVAGVVSRIGRGLRKPPRYVAERAWHEFVSRLEKYRAPGRARSLSGSALARRAGHPSVAALWVALAARPAPTAFDVSADTLEAIAPGERDRLIASAEQAMAHRVEMLGSGIVDLGPEIDWHRDFKTGLRFAPAFCKDIAYNDLDRPNDVKVPWELSRMQWMIPLAQAYRLTGDERYAAEVRKLLDHWIDENPVAYSVNWACTMDVALRGFSWIWFFFAFAQSPEWADTGFRSRFLAMLYQHGDFVSRHLEKADLNGNHYTADAAGLVALGLFFGKVGQGERWADLGWDILSTELPRQVFPDGVDFEASVPYHRLVQELFLYPALYRMRCGLPVADDYRDRLLAMARFTEAYSREDGSVPLWGDADDARTLPFKQDVINDHRYLIGLAGLMFDDTALIARFHGPRQEIAWMLGPEAAARLAPTRTAGARSEAFAEGGFFVLRDDRNHVFIDCGDIGLGGRGGHGHNDILSFEAVLDGVHHLTDCGAYLYTADYRERNNFRSTAYHNTPQIDGEEINRFIRPDYLWVLRNDARPTVDAFAAGEGMSRFSGSHDGYGRLASPLVVGRTFLLDHAQSSLSIEHRFVGSDAHAVEIPFHLAPGVEPIEAGPGRVELRTPSRTFSLSWDNADWALREDEARVSATYGVVAPIRRLTLSSPRATPLMVVLA